MKNNYGGNHKFMVIAKTCDDHQIMIAATCETWLPQIRDKLRVT
jgi:hypothetical protein